MTAVDSQLADLSRIRGEIEGIDRAAREPATATMGPEGTLSYSYGGLSNLSLFHSAEQTVAEIAATIGVILARLAPVATLETSSDGMTVRTVINYTGRATSVWSNSPPTELAAALAEAHLESVKRAYALRAAFAGVVAAAGSALVSIAAAIANPLTVLHALASAAALKQSLQRLVTSVWSGE
jgi:hypothetical protein